MQIPFSEACERNKDPILDVVRPILENTTSVLEIGSGTGQHALYFSQNLPNMFWQTSDQAQYLDGINAQISNAKQHSLELSNCLAPIQIDVTQKNWLPENLIDQQYDVIYSANTLHIMTWQQVQAFFAGLKQVIKNDAYLIIYGPFKYQGKFTSASNQVFDYDLQSRGGGSAIRDFEEVNRLARQVGLVLVNDVTMPANNQCLIWQINS